MIPSATDDAGFVHRNDSGTLTRHVHAHPDALLLSRTTIFVNTYIATRKAADPPEGSIVAGKKNSRTNAFVLRSAPTRRSQRPAIALDALDGHLGVFRPAPPGLDFSGFHSHACGRRLKPGDSSARPAPHSRTVTGRARGYARDRNGRGWLGRRQCRLRRFSFSGCVSQPVTRCVELTPQGRHAALPVPRHWPQEGRLMGSLAPRVNKSRFKCCDFEGALSPGRMLDRRGYWSNTWSWPYAHEHQADRGLSSGSETPHRSKKLPNSMYCAGRGCCAPRSPSDPPPPPVSASIGLLGITTALNVRSSPIHRLDQGGAQPASCRCSRAWKPRCWGLNDSRASGSISKVCC